MKSAGEENPTGVFRKGAAMRRKNRKGFSWRLAAGLLCGAVFLVSMGMAARNLLRSHQEQGAYTALAQQVRDTASLLESAVEPGASSRPPV